MRTGLALIFLGLVSLSTQSYWSYNPLSSIYGYFSGTSAVESSATVENLIGEFEFISSEKSARRATYSLENLQSLKGPITACLNTEHKITILGKSWTFDYWNELLDTAEMCKIRHTICHFAVDGNDLVRSTVRDVLERIERMGHVIMVEPSSHDKTSQMTASALLSAVNHSASAIQSALGKRPTFVRISENKLSPGKLKVLLENNYIPVYATDASKNFLYSEPSRIIVTMMSRWMKTAENDDGKILVGIDDCTGFPAYIYAQQQLS